MSTRRTSTRARLLRLVRKHPDWTAARFAAKLGVSRTRAYQILWSEGYRPEWRLQKGGGRR